MSGLQIHGRVQVDIIDVDTTIDSDAILINLKKQNKVLKKANMEIDFYSAMLHRFDIEFFGQVSCE